MIKKRLQLITWLSFFFITSLTMVSVRSAASEINFSVTPNLPSSQIDTSHSYFDLKLAPKATETATVTLRNSTNENLVIAVSTSRATTNHAGVVQYSSTADRDVDEKMDSSYRNDITKLVVVPKQISIPAHSQIEVPVQIKMPDKAFDGVIAGGLTFKQINTKEKAATGQTNIINRYAYTVGISLRNTIQEITPVLRLGKIDETQLNYRNVIIATVHNKSAMYINNVAVEGFITPKNSSQKLYTVQYLVNQNNVGKQIAPNSTYGIPFYLAGKKFKPGTYHLDLTLISKGHRWHFTKDFKIKSDQIEQYNATDVDIHHINWWLVGGIISVFLCAIWLFIILWRRKKRLSVNLSD
ncbi:DUF916 and DUF3324 domain-containing protein [Leuconostoc lactis]